MANAKKCDRCGAYYDLYPTVENPLTRLAEAMKRASTAKERDPEAMIACIKDVVDLCPGCEESLRRWLSNEQNA